ncbi:ArsR/SmtB family transcription factor [Phyllobacterium zundukense]|jgi:DNA-binding transcriptional ArsR family regulator|uniref:Metalloregulator ArsR/SmtB family transcription factor n=1 Tax=Phyllobacterium zundukense TaxID=1867719 RepID=A0ACD4D3Z2_9HYPH|nr:metalloregulator ArsR/SmtB family transcription factor [Phyllobacterium zundukense]UXN60636.1 metalloregulator ArsR/SmtB family transcription factor [Phyllobacterium zundukense]
MKCTGSFQHHSDANTARILAALAHPARLRIVRQLACLDASCCKDIVAGLDLAQSTVSQHLKVLVDAGLVRYKQSGQSSHYSIDPVAFASIAALVNDMARLCCAPETMIEETQALPELEIAFKD